jgi:hypothetical protein
MSVSQRLQFIEHGGDVARHANLICLGMVSTPPRTVAVRRQGRGSQTGGTRLRRVPDAASADDPRRCPAVFGHMPEARQPPGRGPAPHGLTGFDCRSSFSGALGSASLTAAMTLRMKLISIIMAASAMPDQNRLVGVSVASVSAIRTTACPISTSARILPKVLHVMQRTCGDVWRDGDCTLSLTSRVPSNHPNFSLAPPPKLLLRRIQPPSARVGFRKSGNKDVGAAWAPSRV